MIKINLNPLEATIAFHYLQRTITYDNSECKALYRNLSKSQRIWGVVKNVLGETGAPIKAQEMVYN